MSQQAEKTAEETWVTVTSFYRPPTPEPAFEEIVASEMQRWRETAKQAGLPPETNIRLRHDTEEVLIEISPRLDAFFTPVQTEWKAQ